MLPSSSAWPMQLVGRSITTQWYVLFYLFFIEEGVKRAVSHLMVNNHRRPSTLTTPAAVGCRPLRQEYSRRFNLTINFYK